MEEVRIRLSNALSVMNDGFAFCPQSRNRASHSNAVVVVWVYHGAM
jgi:hypothetical protein